MAPASNAAFADSYCDETEIVHSAGVPGADAHSVSTVVSCTHGTGGRDLSSTGGLHSFVMDHLLCSICQARAGLMPALVFLRRTEGGRGVCVAQTCTDARLAHKTAHIGTTRPTPRSKRLRRRAFPTCAVVHPSTLRPQAALGSGFSLQAAFWYQNAMLARVVADCAASRRLFMLRIKKSSLIRFVAPPFQNANSSFCARIFAMLAGSTPSAWAAPVQTSHMLRHCPLLAFAAVLSHVGAVTSPFPHHVNRFIASKQP